MDVAVVVCNTSDQAPPLPAGWRLLGTVPEPVNRVPAERLKAFAAADFECLLVLDQYDMLDVSADDVDGDAIRIDPWCTAVRRFVPNRAVPSWLQVLATHIDTECSLAIRREALAEVGGFPIAESSVWAWLQRAAAAGIRVGWGTDLHHPEPEQFPETLPGLAPAASRPQTAWVRQLLREFDIRTLERDPLSKHDAIALRAGILQLHDDLDGSHELSQSIEGLGRRHAGDYWHAIMHCREGDFGNSKYWRRRVGRHPLFEDLAPLADEILGKCVAPAASGWRAKVVGGGSWDPYAFIDLCETCIRGRDADLTRAAEEIQFAEMHLLLAATYEDVCRG